MGFYGNATYYLPNGIAQDVAKGVITTEKLAEDAVTAEKVSPKTIQGSKGTKLDDNNNHSSHIATKTIGGGDNGDIAFDTITGGSEAGKGNIANGTIQNYNMANDSIGTNQIINGNITREKIKGQAIGYLEIEPENIYGRAFTNSTEADNIQKSYSHIKECSIAGGESGDIAPNTIAQYNMADNSIGTDQIINGNITKDKLANDYLEYIYYNPDGGITFDSLEAYLRDGKDTGPKKNNILISFQLTQDIDYLSKGNYFAIPCPLDGSYNGGQVFWYLTNLNTKQEWIWNVHGDIQELKNTDINIAEDAIKEQHIENGQIHGSGDNLEHPNYQHIAEKSIGTNDIADRAIKRNQINDWAVQKEHIAGHAIQGLASDDVFILTDGTKKSHIAPESIAGGENGDIAPDTITDYNIADGAITENKLANKFLKIAHYTDQEIPTTLQEICNLLRQSYGGTNTLVTFSLGNSNDINSAVYNGLTPGDYQAYPALMNGSNGAPGYWYLHNLSTDEHWKIETYTQVLNKIYLNDYIDTNLKEYDSVIELKNDLDQHPMKTYIIGMQRAMLNLPSGRYIALPTHEHIGSMKPNRILIHLTTGVSYTLRTTSANTVIVSTYTGHPNTNSEWLTFNQFNETEEIMINGQSYGSGKIMLYNQYQYKDLPIHIWNWTYLVAQLNLSTFNDENKSFTTKCIITGKLPAIGSIKNTTGKQLQFSTGQKIPSGASLNLPNPKDLEGNEIVDSELIKDYGYQIYMELVDFDSDTILCNIQYFQGLNRDLFPGIVIS